MLAQDRAHRHRFHRPFAERARERAPLLLARDQQGDAARIEQGAPAPRLGDLLFTPLDAPLSHAERVRLHVYGALRSLDVHALPWRGAPLLAHASVEYALDLDTAGRPPGDGDALRALLVADPAGDLPAARAEADVVESALARGGWSIERLQGRRAGGPAVRDALTSASLLHYAGHASFGGVDGVESRLLLAGGAELAPLDVVVLPRVPSVVALFEIGRASCRERV